MSIVDDFELQERSAAFQKWWRQNLTRYHWHLLPPCFQGEMHEMIKRAYYAGANFERKKQEPEELGGAI